MSVRTLLIGLDGATYVVLDALMEQGVMPFLRTFLAEGVRADLRTIVPPLTPPAWTSLMTGRRPGQHGVFDFFHLEPESRHIRFFTSHDVHCDTIFALASQNGMRATALNFPSMFPAPRLSGYVVPGWVPWRQLRLACWPEGLLDSLKNLPGFNQRELAMDIKLEEKTTEGCADPGEFGPWIELHIRREHNWFDIFRHLTAEDPSDLTAVLFDGVDKLQHLCWRFIRPEDARPLENDWERQIRDLCLEYFRRLDGLIEQMCALVGPEASVILASDHGFGPTQTAFHINSWFERKGYLAWSEAAGSWDTEGALLGVSQVARHTWMLDWTRTLAFAATPTSNGIYIVVNQDGNSPGIPASEYMAFRARLMAELMAERDPRTGRPIVERIWTREEVFSGPYGKTAPDLTLTLADGGVISILPSTELISVRPEVAGQHRPLGIFAAKGPGLRRGMRAEELSILDVAPAIVHTLGLPVHEEMTGRVPEEIFKPEALRNQPVRHVTAVAAPMDHASGENETIPKMSDEDEQVVLERLRELGYIE
jgi:predicted AlkP superfamily phosphohydrolase/phosphomutase